MSLESTSDLLQVGQHCSIEACNIQDFLPFRCKCNQVFCRDHIFPEVHSCPAVKASLTEAEVVEGGNKLKKCDVEGCKKPTLYAFSSHPERESCEKCKGSYCVLHRYPNTHNCKTSPDPSGVKDEPSAARRLLQKNFGSTPGPSRTTSAAKKKVPTDPIKLAQYKKVELMKMRHKAIPVDSRDKASSVPPEQRLTVNVRYEQIEKVFWFRKSVSGGRAIDMLSTQLQVNPSNSLRTSLCSLDISTEKQTALRNDRDLGEQVEDGTTLVLAQEPST